MMATLNRQHLKLRETVREKSPQVKGRQDRLCAQGLHMERTWVK